MELNAKIPDGPIADKWTNYKFERKLVNPANRRKYDIIVVGTGLAGGAAAATLGEQGYNVKAFTFHDSPRRAHSIAAQGGINAAKNYKGDGDSIYRLFYDTVKGGDFRAREANVYRLAEESVSIIDQMTAQGVPFAREYGGLLDNRSFGGAQVSRTFYARGQTGQAADRPRKIGRIDQPGIVRIDERAQGFGCFRQAHHVAMIEMRAVPLPDQAALFQQPEAHDVAQETPGASDATLVGDIGSKGRFGDDRLGHDRAQQPPRSQTQKRVARLAAGRDHRRRRIVLGDRHCFDPRHIQGSCHRFAQHSAG